MVFWVPLHLSGLKTSNWNYLYSFLFGLFPFFGGIIGMVKSKIWGRFESSLGKSVFYTSLGLFLWGMGETIWSYYNFVVHQPAPYPSIADLGFAPSIVFWVIGVIYLTKASGASVAFRKSKLAKVFTVIVPPLLLWASYYLLVTKARGGVLVPQGETKLKVILDIAYPFGDFSALTIATVILGLSFKYFGGFFKVSIISILLGLGVMFFGDMVFSYTTTVQSYYNADWGDLILTAGVFLMSFGIVGFATQPTAKGEK